MTPKEYVIVIIVIIIFSYIAYLLGNFFSARTWRKNIDAERKDAVKRSRSVIGGQFSEQLAPYLPGFNGKATECRFIGKPIDFLVFTGLDEKEISEVVFVEVKSGSSRLSSVERSLRDAIEQKRVRWEEYRVPLDITTLKNK